MREPSIGIRLTTEGDWHMSLITVEIRKSGSESSLEMRTAFPIYKKFSRDNNSAQDLAPIGSVVLVTRGKRMGASEGIYDRAEE
jgi:5-formyltetrahydrofolate cyclo-ligase